MFVHRLDPVLLDFRVVYFWWYGFSYTAGFTEMFLWLRHERARLGLTLSEVYDLMLSLIVCVLAGGRAVEVIFYEWPYYRAHPAQIGAFWLGGMSTHGLLIGAAAGAALFCRIRGHDFLRIADALTIPGALLMGIGRIGNFIDGQIVGSITAVPWAVKFPDAAGFRHPVVLYDGLKNILIVPLLLAIRRRNPRRGALVGHFFFWYAFLRLFVDVFREYPTSLLGVATGQGLNVMMTIGGLAVILSRPERSEGTGGGLRAARPHRSLATLGMTWRRIALVVLLLFCLLMPSDWTQDVPARYGKRHPGLRHSRMYPPVVQRVSVTCTSPNVVCTCTSALPAALTQVMLPGKTPSFSID
jgi:phosphatidylglycerol:prolipoprotein diacylglycerol transferase